MALTVEELQIVLSCDATSAQKILDQMNATVKAYTEKFKSYFDKLGIDKNPKSIVGDVKAVEKQLDNVTKAIESKGKDWKKAYEKTWGETYEESVRKAREKSNAEAPKYTGTDLTYKDIGKSIREAAKAGREIADAYAKEFYKAKPSIMDPPNTKLLNLGTMTAKGLQAVYAQANKIGAVSDVMREKILQAYNAMQKLGEEYSGIAGDLGGSSNSAQKAEEAYRKAIYAVDKYVQQLDKAVKKEEELAAKRLQKDPKQVRAGNINAENNPQWGHQGEGRMLAPTISEFRGAFLQSLPELLDAFHDGLVTVGKVIATTIGFSLKAAVGTAKLLGKVLIGVGSIALSVGRVILRGIVGALRVAIRVAVSLGKRIVSGIGSKIGGLIKRIGGVGGAIKKAFSHTLLGRFLKRLGTVMMRMAAMKLIRGTIDGVKKGLEELAKVSTSSAKAMNTIKAAGGSIKMALGAAVMPIVKALAPLFVRLAGAISSACNAIARFFAVITGQSTYTAVNFSDSLDGVSDSASGAGKAVKGMLADFDELIVIGNKGGGGGGGSTGVESSLSTVADALANSPFAEMVMSAWENADFTEVGRFIGEKISDALANIDWAAIKASASNVAIELGTLINGFIDTDTAENLGLTIAEAINTAITFISDLIDTTNIEELVSAIGTLISTAVENTDFKGLGSLVTGLVSSLATKVKGADFESFSNNLATKFGDAINSVFSPDEEGNYTFFEDLGVIVGKVAAFIGKCLEKVNWDDVWNSFVAFVKSFTDTLLEAFGVEGGLERVSLELQVIANNLGIFFKEVWGDFLSMLDTPLGHKMFDWLGLQTAIDNNTTALADAKQKAKDLQDQLDSLSTSASNTATSVDGATEAVKDYTIEARKMPGEIKAEAKMKVTYSGPSESKLTKVSEAIKNFTNKTVECTINVAKDAVEQAQEFAKVVKEIKDKKATLTAKLSGNKVKEFTDTATAFEKIDSKEANLKLNTSDITASKLQTLEDAKQAIKALPDKKSIAVEIDAKLNNAQAITDAIKAAFKAAKANFKVSYGGTGMGNVTIEAMAKGGIAFGPTLGLVGEYAGARSNPEVIAPLSKLTELLSTAGATGGSASTAEQNELLREQNRLLRQIAQKELVISPSTLLGQVIYRSQQLYART